MKRFPANIPLSLLAILCFVTTASAKTSTQKYFSPDHKVFAVVYKTQATGEVMPESIVSIYNTQNKSLQRKSYISPDHEHGYCVVHLKWSADSKYCVWSLTSSGGHSPWHFPTDCYIQKCKAIVNIDAQLKCGLTQAEFKLKAPHIFLSQRLIPNPSGDPKYAKVSLDLMNLKCP